MDAEKAVQELTIDEERARIQFLERITDYTMADAKRTALPWVSQSLRSKSFYREWARELALLAAKMSVAKDKEFNKRLQELRNEASALKQKYHLEQQKNVLSVSSYVTEKLGPDFFSYSMHEVTVKLNVEVVILLKEISSILKEFKK